MSTYMSPSIYRRIYTNQNVYFQLLNQTDIKNHVSTRKRGVLFTSRNETRSKSRRGKHLLAGYETFESCVLAMCVTDRIRLDYGGSGVGCWSCDCLQLQL